MAITTLDGLVAGALAPLPLFKVVTAVEAVGVLHSQFYATGIPGAAAQPAPGVAGAALTTYAGQIPWVNPASGNTYVLRWSMAATVACGLWLMDRLWHNSGIVVTTTGAQTINSVAFPARDRDGSTNGAGVMVAIEVFTATTNAGAVANTTMSYTNQSGTAGRKATMAAFPATAQPGTFVPFQLAAGDTGVRSIQSVTLGTSYGAGAIHLVAYRPLINLGLTLANMPFGLGAVGSGIVRLFDNSVLWTVQIPTATGASTHQGTIGFAQG